MRVIMRCIRGLGEKVALVGVPVEVAPNCQAFVDVPVEVVLVGLTYFPMHIFRLWRSNVLPSEPACYVVMHCIRVRCLFHMSVYPVFNFLSAVLTERGVWIHNVCIHTSAYQ